MEIKKKITLGIFYFFVEFLVIALFSSYSIYTISQQSERIMKDNNLSIQYAAQMQQTLDQINALQLDILFNPQRKDRGNALAGLYEAFDRNLSKEEANITEPGEREVLRSLKGEYQQYRESVAEIASFRNVSSHYFQNLLPKYQSIKDKIHRVSDINMQAILIKNERVNRYERRSYVILSVLASLCFLLSIIILFNFPGVISNPIRRLSEALRDVAAGRYESRLDFGSGREFREMEQAVKAIVQRLKETDNSQWEAVRQEREGLARTVDLALERLRASREQIQNLELKKLIDAQASLIETLQAELEQARFHLKPA